MVPCHQVLGVGTYIPTVIGWVTDHHYQEQGDILPLDMWLAPIEYRIPKQGTVLRKAWKKWEHSHTGAYQFLLGPKYFRWYPISDTDRIASRKLYRWIHPAFLMPKVPQTKKSFCQIVSIFYWGQPHRNLSTCTYIICRLYYNRDMG